MAGWLSPVRCACDDLAFDATQEIHEKKYCTPLILRNTSSNSKLFDAIWHCANWMSSAQTRHIALQDRALQSLEIWNNNLKYTHTVYLRLLPTLINIVRITDLRLKFWIVSIFKDKECDSHMKRYPMIGEFKKNPITTVPIAAVTSQYDLYLVFKVISLKKIFA